METPSQHQLLQQLLESDSLRTACTLAESSGPLNVAFEKNKLEILKKHVHPDAWHDAISCVDNRIRLKGKARKAFDQDYQSRAMIDGDRRNWSLRDLTELTLTIEQLIEDIGQSGTAGPGVPSKQYNSLREWEAAWEARRPAGSVTNHFLGGKKWQETDHGSEHVGNFENAFSRHTKFTQDAVPFEGVLMNDSIRNKLQRAFFRLEFIRRAYYHRPLFPKGAKWQSFVSTMVNGEAESRAGETHESRLARAEAIFDGWEEDDFTEIICAFKATLNVYAEPVARMMREFRDDVHSLGAGVEPRRMHAYYGAGQEELLENRKLVGLQWEIDPVSLRPDLPLMGTAKDDQFEEMRWYIMDEQKRLDAYHRRRVCWLDCGEYDDLGCTIFKATDVRQKRKTPGRQPASLPETNPEEEMSKFFHVLCSLPLKFMREFAGMSERRQRRFLKSSYHAISRIKGSHAPRFLSGEVMAWTSKPADERGERHWDHVATRRIFPELSVRCAVLTCVSHVYPLADHAYSGWHVPLDGLNCPTWAWQQAAVTPLMWADLRSKIRYKPFGINPVLRMDDVSWQMVWRSDRRVERLIWTGPDMKRARWEGYGDAGRLDPNECYCHFGEGCGFCLPLPRHRFPEWELYTDDEKAKMLSFYMFLKEGLEKGKAAAGMLEEESG